MRSLLNSFPYMVRLIKNFDYSIIIVLCWLSFFGLVMVYSASLVVAVIVYEYPIDFFYQKQLKSLIFAGTLFLITCFIPYQFYRRLYKLAIILSLFLLFFVLWKGKAANNAVQWIAIGPLSIQPSELIKLSVILYLSTILTKKQQYLNQLKGIFPPVILVSVILLLIMVQPDFGTTMVIALITYIIIICSGMKKLHIYLFTLVGAICLFIFFAFLASEEQLSRFGGAYKPFEDPTDSGYHLINSYIAFASGGLSGRGFGDSIQKFGYLPEPHTDFIIAVIGEEFGFLGIFMVISLLGYIVVRGFIISMQCRDNFGSLFAIGIAAFIGTQTFINIGVASGMLPITGVTLPFISFGGSSLLSVMLAMGILVNISAHNKLAEKENNNNNVIPLHKSYQG
jgi:cell division protein FtsW